MPERVLPEPVSPVINQPRQKSSRVQAETGEADNDVLFRFPQKLNDQTRCCTEATKSSDSCDEIRTHRRRSINTPATAPSADAYAMRDEACSVDAIDVLAKPAQLSRRDR